MRTFEEIKQVVDQITYKKGWTILLSLDGGQPMLQVEFIGEDVVTGAIEKQKCRKWRLSYHMCNNELVGTAFKAIQAAEEHESREFFKYKNVRVMNPHFSYDDIVDLVNDNKLREDARK
jgi:hypothetical protein